MTDSDLQHYVLDHTSCRNFAVWHDHSTICGYGIIMVTCKDTNMVTYKEVYDTIVHYTDAEFKAMTGQPVLTALQTTALTVDRLDCIQTMGTTLHVQDESQITDTHRVFNE